MSSSTRTIGELSDHLAAHFPPAWADDWDNVGLVLGERDRQIAGIRITLDATAEAVERASTGGANVLLTHHPPYLGTPEPVRSAGPAGTLEAAIRSGVAVISLHTNLDRSPEGATALPDTLGFRSLEPLETSSEPVSLIVTYVPEKAAPALRKAMADAGAGRLGRYDQCSFTSEGVGRFRALEGADPALPAGDGIDEVRIEMVSPRGVADSVAEAARLAHPYEEPVILSLDGVRARGIARLGRLCAVGDGSTLGTLAEHVSESLGVACRVWGDPAAPVARLGVANGSGGSLIPAALHRADALLLGEVRYHDALAAAAAGLGIIEAGHDATEWPMVRVLEAAVRAWDPSVVVTAEAPSTGWWTTKGPKNV